MKKMFRRKMSKYSSKRNFRRSALKIHKKNLGRKSNRGGIRL